MATTKNNGALNMNESLSKSEAFFDKYRKAIIYGIIALFVIIAAVILYHNYVAVPRAEKASTTLAKGQEYFGAGAFDKALNGDGAGFEGFIKIADDYSSTDAGTWQISMLDYATHNSENTKMQQSIWKTSMRKTTK